MLNIKGSSIEDILDSIASKKLKAKRKEIQDAIRMNMSPAQVDLISLLWRLIVD